MVFYNGQNRIFERIDRCNILDGLSIKIEYFNKTIFLTVWFGQEIFFFYLLNNFQPVIFVEHN